MRRGLSAGHWFEYPDGSSLVDVEITICKEEEWRASRISRGAS
jgi:hypothetical protein